VPGRKLKTSSLPRSALLQASHGAPKLSLGLLTSNPNPILNPKSPPNPNPQVNRSLLNPAGYHCDAFYWCTKGHNGEAEHHMVMRIVKVTKLEAELHASYS